MKKKNRTGILTALLAVLSLQRVESKNRIGIITVLAVLLLASMPTQAHTDPLGCQATTLKILGTFDDPTIVTNGVTTVHYAVFIGTGGVIGGCNIGNFPPNGTGDGVTITFTQPPLNGKQPVDPLSSSGNNITLATDKSFSENGTDDVCYYGSAAGLDWCKLQPVTQGNIINVPGMDWLTNVNDGVLQATARAIVTCPSGQCSHRAEINDQATASQDVSVNVIFSIPNTTLTKTANPKNGTALPFTTTYTFNETNTGNVNLTNVHVTDSDCTPTLVGTPFTKQQPLGVLDVLEPGATATFTCTKTYNTSGTFTNTAFGHGNPTLYDPGTNKDVIGTTRHNCP